MSEHDAPWPDRRRWAAGLILVAAAVVTIFFVAALRWTSPAPRGTVRRNSKDGLDYVWIPAGGFRAGCSGFDEQCNPEEKPAHDVTISKGFWIGQLEVPVAAYRRFVASKKRPMPPEPTFGSRSLNPGWSQADLPIVNVTWDEAQAFCSWAGGALPTEAQWEYAARGGEGGPRHGHLSAISWFGDNSGAAPLDTAALSQQDEVDFLGRLSLNGNSFHPGGRLAPNGAGLYDVLGNVWEWAADSFDENFYRESGRFDPVGRQGDTKTLRGGSWTNPPQMIRVSVRGRRPPDARSIDTGFRCAQ